MVADSFLWSIFSFSIFIHFFATWALCVYNYNPASKIKTKTLCADPIRRLQRVLKCILSKCVSALTLSGMMKWISDQKRYHLERNRSKKRAFSFYSNEHDEIKMVLARVNLVTQEASGIHACIRIYIENMNGICPRNVIVALSVRNAHAGAKKTHTHAHTCRGGKLFPSHSNVVYFEIYTNLDAATSLLRKHGMTTGIFHCIHSSHQDRSKRCWIES